MSSEIQKDKQTTAIATDTVAVAGDILKEELGELRQIKQILQKKTEVYSGPLPHPDHFKHYNATVPGAGNRLLSMVEKDLAHTHITQKIYTFTDSVTSILGVVSAFLISVGGIGGGMYLVLEGHDAAGVTIAGTTLAGIVYTFIHGTRHKNNNSN